MCAASCVDGPRLARDHLACSAEVACSHVSGLLVQSGWTAGPDGFREPSPHYSNGIDVPMKRQVWLGCVGIDRLCHHASLLSRKLQNVAQRPKPPRPRAGSSHAGASPPRRCARSCWLALPPLIRSRRKYGLPRLDIPPRRCLPPVEFCRGTRPSQAANSRPLRKPLGSTTVAARAVAMIGPMPGTLARRWLDGVAFVPGHELLLDRRNRRL